MDDINHQDLLKAYEEAVNQHSELKQLEEHLQQNRYCDEELIDEGGAKKIHLSTDLVSGRRIARAYPKSSDFQEDFLREARLHALLEHPNIIPLYDIGIENQSPYFSMKFIQGENLEHYILNHIEKLKHNDFRNKLLDVFLKVCDAVSYAHSLDVLHLDLKPANIQLSDYGEVFVGDWGLARVQGYPSNDQNFSSEASVSSGQFTRYGYLAGTPGFMAPEQCEKGSTKTTATDIYALGALLVYLFSGKPHVLGNQEQQMQSTIQAKYDYDESQLPQGLLGVIRKSLSLDPQLRYSSVKELIDDINAYRTGYLTSADEHSNKLFLKSIYRRNKTLINLTLAALTLLLGITSAFISRLKQSETTALAALQQAEQSQAEKKQQGETFATHYLQAAISYYYQRNRGRYGYSSAQDNEAYKLVSKALKLDPSGQEAWALKGRLAMLTQRLPEAVAAFEMAGSNYQDHLKVCRNYQHENLNNLSKLSAMLEELEPTNDLRLIHDFMFKTIFSKKPIDQKMIFIEESLNLRNRGPQSRLNFTYDFANRSLDLSHNRQLYYIFMIKNLPLREIDLSYTSVSNDFYHLERLPLVKVNVAYSGMNNQGLNFLKGKPIRELNIEGCKVSQLNALIDMPLQKLNLYGTKVKDFSPLVGMNDLQEVICSRLQYPAIEKVLKGRERIIKIKNAF